MILFFLLLKLLFPSPVILLFSLLLASNDQLRYAKNLPSSSFKFYRNVVNSERKSCKASFYKVKVEHMKDENPKLCWKEVKRLSGSQSNSGNVINHIHIGELEDFNNQELANIINKAFPEPLEEYRLNSRLPKIWKFADVSPLPKVKPVEDLKKHLRPISLTPCLSKVAEECVVVDYVKSAVLNVLDPSQYGAVPKSSTTQALIHMLHHWTKGCDGNGATVTVTLYDYKKAFDLIDHRILVNKLCKLDLPTEIINWIIDFLSDRSQRIKLSEGCYSEWGSVSSKALELKSNPQVNHRAHLKDSCLS